MQRRVTEGLRGTEGQTTPSDHSVVVRGSFPGGGEAFWEVCLAGCLPGINMASHTSGISDEVFLS